MAGPATRAMRRRSIRKRCARSDPRRTTARASRRWHRRISISERSCRSDSACAVPSLGQGGILALELRHDVPLFLIAQATGLFQPVGGVEGSDELEQPSPLRSEEHTSELQSRENLVCRLLLEKKKKKKTKK